jgi:hypothetical protein
MSFDQAFQRFIGFVGGCTNEHGHHRSRCRWTPQGLAGYLVDERRTNG